MKNISSGLRKTAATISVMLCSSVYMFYVTSRAVALPTIMSQLNGMSFYSVTIILSSLSMALVTPLSGKMGDMFGRKKIFIFGLLGYLISLLGCAFSVNVYMFMLSVALTGITNGFVTPQMLALMTDIYDDSERPRILSYNTVASAVASLIGPIIGGMCADKGSWQMIFFIMLPFALINLICGFVGMPDVPAGSPDGKIDVMGTVLFITCIAPFLLLLTNGGTMFPWMSLTSLLLSLLSVVSLVFLIKQEKKCPNSIIPVELFKNPLYVLCLTVSIVNGICYSGMNYLPIYYQAVRGLTSTVSGFMAMPRQIANIGASLLMGAYLSRHSNFKKAAAVPMFLFCAGLAVFGFCSASTALWLIVIAEFFYGAANGGIMISSTAMGQYYLEPSQMGVGLAFISFSSTIGNSLGSAMTGCIVNSFWNVRKILPVSLLNALTDTQINSLSGSTVLSSPEAVNGIRDTLDPNMQEAFMQGISDISLSVNKGINTAMMVSAVLALAVLIAVLVFRWKKYSRPKCE